ncbi:hypothetical protein SAMN05444274_102520 [Mariniphaga anaerophila]|uniref:Uncharacterized protein n=1 Tax=Mariniphaga anaerophila TaxID=1484053 RepID=A0A1M4WQ39_9BACT|nr:hypothetical protein SAMN05444274_102520 [Mariniphaga anaerophila]
MAKSMTTKKDFNSSMVRLIAGELMTTLDAIKHFNSSMVRLIVIPVHSISKILTFQFQYGAINRHCLSSTGDMRE